MEHTPLTGILADRYALEREIGRGATATVYLARDIRHERSVAVKVLSAAIAQVLGADRFLREIRIAATLQHPNVLPLYDSGEADGLLYYVMPYIAGDTLRTRLTAERRLPVAEAVTIAREAADALAHAHEAGIVHRDIKPENILLEAGHAVVADFGIARAIGAATTGGAAGARQALTAGLAIGTPGYMSPEQLAADETIDGRSDIFALGCVLYEMLTGEVPSTVHARTTDSGRRTPQRLPSLRITRPDVPRWLEPVLARALAETAADRYPDARAFGAALAAGAGAAPAPVSWRRKVGLSAAAVAVATVLVWAGGKLLGPGSPPLDYDRYVVLPLLHRGAVAPRALNGDLCATMVYDALSRWPDIAKVNSLNVSNLLQREGTLPKTLDQALEVTRRLGAGRLLWGEVYEIQNRTYVRMVAYDVRQPRKAMHETLIDFPSDGSENVTSRFFSATDTLVYGGASGPAARGTSSFGALMAYARGDSALRQWDLDLAQQRFEMALAMDPAYSWANLKLAQVSQWRLRSAEVWKTFAQRAADSSSGLPAEERLRAAALVDLAEQRYPQSCAKYRNLLKRDANDFQAWFGLGECQQQDELVLPDRASPSRYRFRSSYQAALNAYLKALDLVPAAHRAFQEMIWARLDGVLYTHGGQYRIGRLGGGAADTAEMAAFPSFEGDTLRFVPAPRSELFASAQRRTPGTDSALAFGRRIMEEVSRTWVAAFPRSSGAWQARALALERSGQLTGREDESALGAIRKARTFATAPVDSLRLGAVEVRVRVKTLDGSGARVLAESLLASKRDPTAREALRLAPLAGLLGKLTLLSSLLERGAPAYGFGTAAGRPVTVPASLAAPAMRLAAFSVLGSSVDTLRALELRLDRSISDWRGRDRNAMREALLEQPAMFGYPTFGARPMHRAGKGSYLFVLQQRLVRGDTAGVHRSLLDLERSPIRLTASPGDISVDIVYQEAWLLLAVHDTVEASAALDRSLNNLSIQWELPFELYQGPPGLIAAMGLRARVAAIQGDSTTARRWAAAVLDLRANSDPGTTPDLATLRGIALPRQGPP